MLRRSQLTVCAVFKNEATNLHEWLSFHDLMGVQKFILYNDDSSDNFMEILQPWIDSKKLTLRSSYSRHLNRARAQKEIYNHCLNRERLSSKWIAFIDLDEFLFSPKGLPLPIVLRQFRKFPAVLVRWFLFGSGGNTHKDPDTPVIERYLMCQGVGQATLDSFEHGSRSDDSNYVTGWSRCGKSIVNPLRVWEMGIHLPQGKARSLTVEEDFKPHRWRSVPGTPFSTDVLRINHYWSKSIEELTKKIDRGALSKIGRPKRNLSKALRREEELNNVYDDTILRVRDGMLSRATGEH